MFTYVDLEEFSMYFSLIIMNFTPGNLPTGPLTDVDEDQNGVELEYLHSLSTRQGSFRYEIEFLFLKYMYIILTIIIIIKFG